MPIDNNLNFFASKTNEDKADNSDKPPQDNSNQSSTIDWGRYDHEVQMWQQFGICQDEDSHIIPGFTLNDKITNHIAEFKNPKEDSSLLKKQCIDLLFYINTLLPDDSYSILETDIPFSSEHVEKLKKLNNDFNNRLEKDDTTLHKEMIDTLESILEERKNSFENDNENNSELENNNTIKRRF